MYVLCVFAGTHRELMEAKGVYAEMWRLQQASTMHDVPDRDETA